jgi:hypothetical protein
MAQDNAIHVKNINGAPTMFDVHGGALGVVGTSLKIGATVEVTASLVNGAGLTHLSLDPNSATYYFSNGLTLNPAKDGFIVPQDGRYLVTANLQFSPHATLWTHAIATTSYAGGNGEVGSVTMAPDSVAGSGRDGIVQFSSLFELSAGGVIGWQASIIGANATINDSYLSIQYIGPKTGVS